MVRLSGCEECPLVSGVSLASALSLPGYGAIFFGVEEPFSFSRLIGGVWLTAANDGERFTGVKPPGRLTAVKPGVWRIGISDVGACCSCCTLSVSIEALRMLEARIAGDSWRAFDGVADIGRFATGERLGDGV